MYEQPAQNSNPVSGIVCRLRSWFRAGLFCHISARESWLMRPNSTWANMLQGTIAPSARTEILLLGQPQAVRRPPIGKGRLALCPCLLHPAPHAPIRQWAGVVPRCGPWYFAVRRSKVAMASLRSSMFSSTSSAFTQHVPMYPAELVPKSGRPSSSRRK